MPPKHPLTIFRRTTLVALALLAFLGLSRLLLLMLQGERVAATEGAGIILLQGLRFDGILLGLLFAIPVTLLPWLHLSRAGRWLRGWFLPGWFALVIPLAVFVEAASAPFIAQFDSRPNYLFVEYLAYPKEVLATVSGLHLGLLVGVSTVCLALAIALFRTLRRDPARDLRTGWGFALLMTPLLLVLFLGLIRSSLQHRPANPSNAAFSPDTMVNTLPLNSPYLVLYSIYEHRRDAKGAAPRYGALPDETVVAHMRASLGLSPAQFLDPAIPTLHRQAATHASDGPKNVVIVLMESVGAEHVSALGGRDLMPTFSTLSDQGLWFDRLYATGMRSARGLEAVLSGFTPSTMEAAVKAALTQTDFFTIAEYLRRQGYDTSFLYGGESNFDNMRRFFLNNGIETVVDQSDFSDPIYLGSWGVSDEDLFLRAHEHFERLTAEGDAPFFSLVFTSSNHEPFDVPAGRVEPHSDKPGTGEPPGRATAIAYSDWALGQFLERARGSSYWDDTVFLVVSDHNARTWGGQLVPVERFRIPGVFLGAHIAPRRMEGIVSQIDLVPTLLSLAGVSGAHPATGRDLTLERWQEGAGRAVMHFHGLQAYLEGEQAVILQPDRAPAGYRLLPDGSFEPAPAMDPALVERGLAYALWGPLMMRTGAYRLPAEP